jgi:UDP-N-acetylglucosamine diphosphorylase/glucosamine-1-phosphate N-acetyltransferase
MHDCAGTAMGYETREYLAPMFPAAGNADVRINGQLMPTAELVAIVKNLKPGEQLVSSGKLLAARSGNASETIEAQVPFSLISRPYDIFIQLQNQIAADIDRLTANRNSQKPSATNTIIGNHPLFLEEGVKMEGATINTSNGPVYLGKNSEVMEGSLVRGPFAMAEGSVLKLGAKVYGPTALGPYCVIGGEVNNIQMQGYSNKGHDGFLGNAVLGEWCNIGADSNCSNLKNNYEDVKVWNYSTGRFDKSGQQFCGLIMGDHSKCGINTMFNTGTVVGVAANIFGSGFPRQFVPDFAWGGASGFTTYKLDAACKTASLVMPRRKKEFTKNDEEVMAAVFQFTQQWRNWE